MSDKELMDLARVEIRAGLAMARSMGVVCWGPHDLRISRPKPAALSQKGE